MILIKIHFIPAIAGSFQTALAETYTTDSSDVVTVELTKDSLPGSAWKYCAGNKHGRQ
jgi:hypothetical protein